LPGVATEAAATAVAGRAGASVTAVATGAARPTDVIPGRGTTPGAVTTVATVDAGAAVPAVPSCATDRLGREGVVVAAGATGAAVTAIAKVVAVAVDGSVATYPTIASRAANAILPGLPVQRTAEHVRRPEPAGTAGARTPTVTSVTTIDVANGALGAGASYAACATGATRTAIAEQVPASAAVPTRSADTSGAAVTRTAVGEAAGGAVDTRAALAAGSTVAEQPSGGVATDAGVPTNGHSACGVKTIAASAAVAHDDAAGTTSAAVGTRTAVATVTAITDPAHGVAAITTINTGIAAGVVAVAAIAKPQSASAAVGVRRGSINAVADQKLAGNLIDDVVDLCTNRAVDPVLQAGVDRGVDPLIEELRHIEGCGVGSPDPSRIKKRRQVRRSRAGEGRIDGGHPHVHIGSQRRIDVRERIDDRIQEQIHFVGIGPRCSAERCRSDGKERT